MPISIDITLMVINMVAGLFLLAYYVYQGLDSTDQTQWIPGFGMTGGIALATGLHMIWTGPNGSFGSAFGETTVLFGSIFIAAAVALAQGWELLTVAIYAFFAGIAGIVVGLDTINHAFTNQPLLSGIGLILTGLGGVIALPTLYLKTNRTWRLILAAVLIAAALSWALTGYLANSGYFHYVAEPIEINV